MIMKSENRTAADIVAAVSPQVKSLKEELRLLHKRYDALRLESGSISNFMDDIATSVRPIKPVAPIYETPKKGEAHVSSPVEACLHLTDWHIGEVVKAEETEGINAFSPEIADKRITKLGKIFLDWIEVRRQGYQVDTLRVLCTGDFISGDIHPELVTTNAYPIPMQATEAGHKLAKLVSGLAPHFKDVIIEFLTVDNHSRLTKKIQFSEAGLNSMGFIVGSISKLMLRDHENIIFNLHTVASVVVKIAGTGFQLRHGHTIRGVMGIPYYGFDRAARNQSRMRLNNPKAPNFSIMLCGHFHAPARMGGVGHGVSWWIGGSLGGTTALDHAFDRFAPPCQTAFLMHPKHGDLDYNVFKL